MATNLSALGSYTSPVRTIGAEIAFSDGTNTITINEKNYLKSIRTERIGDNTKFFGFGISQKLSVKVLDINNEINLTTSHSGQVKYSIKGGSYVNASPTFTVSEVHRDEVTGEKSITAYDALHKASEYTFADLGLVAPYTIKQVVTAIGAKIGARSTTAATTTFNNSYDNGANFDGTETLLEVLIAAAEATQTIFYITQANILMFKRLSKTSNPVTTITKEMYFNLESGENKRLAKIVNTNELEDSTFAETTETGSTQYVRDNPFWDLREDIATQLNNALTYVGGLTINQLTCNWRGFPFFEAGDKIAFTTKDGSTVTSFLFNDVVEYDGTLKQTIEWKYENNDSETDSNPVTLGDTLKQTYAKVDKANKRIDLVVSDVDETKEAVAQISVTTDEINQTVRGLADDTSGALEGVNEEIAKLYNEVNTKMTKEDYTITIDEYIEENGVKEIITSNGYKFTKDGLIIEDVDGDGNRVGETATKIDNNGMKVFDINDEEMLTANAEGVNAKNLHATTYLIIGANSRFEDWGNRTGCFWIGGA
jgi:hypothetical protein